MSTRLRFKSLFSRKANAVLDEEQQQHELRRTESTSTYMQQKRCIYVNMELPTLGDDDTESVAKHYVSNRVRTAKYTPLTFLPKNLFEQFRNVANLYFLLLVILQCIPVFGVVEPAVSALPLIAILVITGIKDAFEDWKRNQSDDRVNNAKTLTLAHWKNVNALDNTGTRFRMFHLLYGFICTLAGKENRYSHAYRLSRLSKKPVVLAQMSGQSLGSTTVDVASTSSQPVPQEQADAAQTETGLQPSFSVPDGTNSPTDGKRASQKLLSSVRHHSDTLRSLSNIFKPLPARKSRQPYRPGSIPHSVLYRSASHDGTSVRRPSSVHPDDLKCADRPAGDPPSPNCKVWWQQIRWQDVSVGDYVMLQNNDEIPADIVILSTSETDNLCYIETQNLDGETNLKARQGLTATAGLQTVHDCERARFYIESEPPHANLYQYNGALRWDIDQPEDNETTVSHQKTEVITYNNILLRGCVLRNTKWVIGIVVFTGSETKIMLNSGRTPSKRSKIQKETNPHVIANFVLLAIICIISSVMDSVQFRSKGSSNFFDFGIRGHNPSYDGFLTFWVTLILYQNIVPISLYISVEIVKTLAAYFIFADIDLYYEKTDQPCIPRTWNISDDLGQIEYIFSDKTGTLTQNVMEFRKCTIGGVSYGLGSTEGSRGADMRAGLADRINEQADQELLERTREEMIQRQSAMFNNEHAHPRPTFVDPLFFEHLAKDDAHSESLVQFMTALALCHTVIPERPDSERPEFIDFKAQSPDEAALVATARDLGFTYLGRESKWLTVEIMGEKKVFELLNILEFNSTRKRMSVIVKPQDSDKIILLCKGADSVIGERLAVNFGDQTELERKQRQLWDATNADLERFAKEGLRTLCLAYRFISPSDYKAWNKRYDEAAASLNNREEKVDQACEEIERDLLLMGGTAIEDRLQEGVPETIAELAASGIKLWVLTGDKVETAINIGYACNLITEDMDLHQMTASSKEETHKKLKDELSRTAPSEKTTSKLALVIDGMTLKYALDSVNRDLLLELTMRCASVLCCRVSPKQKAQIVQLVKRGLKVMTLAIGDGANDVSMIQEANVGIGIAGVEGRQAVMAADYVIAQFRFLRKLLVVHGRWSYLRTAEMVMGFFYKNIVWTFVLFWFQMFCQFTGTMIYDYALVTLYNVVFTSLPIIFMGIWDQDLSADVSLLYPELYLMGMRNDKFKVWRFYATIFDSIFQSSVCFYFPYMMLVAGSPDAHGFDANGVYEIGTIMSSISVIVANLFVALCLYSYTWIQVAIIAASILVYYAFVSIYAQFNTFVFAGHVRLFGLGYYWLILILTVVASFLPRVAVKYWRRIYYPYDNGIIREQVLVKHEVRKDPHHAASKQETG